MIMVVLKWVVTIEVARWIGWRWLARSGVKSVAVLGWLTGVGVMLVELVSLNVF